MPFPVSKLDELGDSVRQVIKAYHGSPYDFDKFDASKIGTGEGNQAYGHGLYFAGNEDVAYDYRDARAAALSPEEKLAQARLLVEQEELIARSRKHFAKYPPSVLPPPEDAVERMTVQHLLEQNERAMRPLIYKRGKMYEVEIPHSETALLDWDAPMSKQPARVRRAYGSLAMDMPGDGGRVYRDIAARLGEDFDDDMTGILADRAAAGELLAEGIPGIRYFDQGSRNAGAGTRNYVMFPGTEDSIRILRKYGIAAPVAAGALNEDE
jgi:hypothetical protein